MIRRRGTREALVAAVAGSLAGAALVAAHGDTSYLHGCHRPEGVVRLIAPPEPDDPTPCESGEILSEWAVRGAIVDGPPGPRGLTGAAGARGAAGRDGRPGPRYGLRTVRHTVTASGRAASTARCGAAELALAGGWSVGAGRAVTGAGRSGEDAWTVRTLSTGGASRSRVSVYVVCARAVAR